MSEHEEYGYHNGNDTVIVFIHGVLGTPDQFRFLAQRLSDHFDCEALLLPGHGGTAMDFASTPGKLWVSYAFERIDQIRQNYKKLYLVGHSMGGMICLLYAACHDVTAVATINTPLRVRIGQLAYRRRLRKNAVVEEIRSNCERSYGLIRAKFYQRPMWLRQYLSLLTMMRQCRAAASAIESPVLVTQSSLDETVYPGNALLLCRNLPETGGPVYLPESYHAYFAGDDRQKLIESIRRFFDGH